ncbi:MmgE/PrpD family protein [Mesorhizobium sp. CN2-181]|uniref:MmgE/PrpD family protein n=1 Tax=Mesorhizobium yinganensis TaxID=3157707 RepID=UPI0032B7D2F1
MTSAEPNPVERVARHIVDTSFQSLPAAAVTKTKAFLLDTLGVGIAGTSGAGVAELKEVAADLAPGADEATVWLTGERMAAQSAALVNAYQIHCLEFDCVHERAVLHPMATILSAVFAWAERRKARTGELISGRDFITALAIGVDISTMLGSASNAPLTFFRPATAGGLGAAAAIAKLAGADVLWVKNALGAQYSQTSGTMQAHVEGSPMLGMQVGFNARAAIAANDLAAAGFRGPHDLLTGRYGYFVLYEKDDYDLAPELARLGREWQIDAMSHKPYPSGRLTHGSIDALGQLMKRDGFSPADIARIVCRVPPLVHRLVGRPDIPNPEPNYAKLCLPFVAGVFLSRGHVDVPDFRGREMLDDPEAHRFASLVDVQLDDNPDPNAMDPQSVTVWLRDGSEHSITLPYVYGHPKAALTREENIDKFRRCCGYGLHPLPEAQVDEIVTLVDALDAAPDITRLVDLMRAS